MSFTDEEILSQLQKTADGEYITPETELWQIDPGAWRVDNVFSFQQVDDHPIFSSEAAAKRSIRDDSQVAADQCEHVKSLTGCLTELLAATRSALPEQRLKDLESHIVGMQVRAENDAILIKQQAAQIKSLQDTVSYYKAAPDDQRDYTGDESYLV